eukprot:IDg8258t1
MRGRETDLHNRAYARSCRTHAIRLALVMIIAYGSTRRCVASSLELVPARCTQSACKQPIVRACALRGTFHESYGLEHNARRKPTEHERRPGARQGLLTEHDETLLVYTPNDVSAILGVALTRRQHIDIWYRIGGVGLAQPGFFHPTQIRCRSTKFRAWQRCVKNSVQEIACSDKLEKQRHFFEKEKSAEIQRMENRKHMQVAMFDF